MKDVLAAGGRRDLAAFVRRGTLVALDLDGTLAPIASSPSEAVIPASTRELLKRLGRHYPMIVLTGRSRADALHVLGGVPVLEVIGSHGLETPGAAVLRFAQRVAGWRAQLAERLRSLVGVSIEDKRYSLAVHYRHAADPAEALQRIEHATAGLSGARLLGGKKVVNLLPEEAPGKDAALLAACARLGCDRALYVGDDETDEDVFALRDPRIFGIRVGGETRSAAPFFLADQGRIDELLEALLALTG